MPPIGRWTPCSHKATESFRSFPATLDSAFHRSWAIGADEAGRLPINVARAEIVERNAVIEALRSGHLGGFALDPLYEEPGRQDDELLAFDNVILTPHMAGSPRSNGLRDIEELITGLAQALLE